MTFADSQLWARIVRHATSDPHRLAYVEPDAAVAITYGQMVERALALADGIAASPVMRGDNTVDFPLHFLGTLLRGGSVMPAPLLLSPAEERRLAALGRQVGVAGIEPSLLLTTSGTTAEPRIVRRTVESLDAVAAAMVYAIGFAPADRVIAAVPLSHSYGIEHGLLAPLWAGSTVLLCDGMDVPQLLSALTSGATIFPAVPSMIEMLVGPSGPLSFAKLRRVYTAGAPLPSALAAAFEQRFGIAIGQVYGATEIGSVLYRDPLRDAAGTVGRAMQGVSIRVLSSDAVRRVLSAGEDGEVAIAAPSMLAGYLNEAGLEEAVELVDGHYPTGDIGRLSGSGELTLVGRVRLLIDVGGAKVNPLEVERVLESHPAVAAAVVLPLRLSATVNKVRAIVVAADPQSPPTAAALRAHAREHLAAYKVPRVFDFRTTLPRTAAGKIARQTLEAECLA